jgi:hypothetical protein
MIKLEYYEKEKRLLAYNQDKINDSLNSYEFIGEIALKDLTGNIIELDGPVARPTYGLFLYQMAAMLMSQKDCYLCLPRDTDIREAALKPFVKIWENVGENIKSIKVPEEYNDEYYDFTNEEEHPFFFEALNIKETEAFKNSITIYEQRSESLVPKDVLEEWNDYFRHSYENDSNKFINEENPMRKAINIDEFLSFKPKEKKQNKKRFRM